MLDGAKRILELYKEDEFKVFIVEGDNGFGKTTYCNRLISEVYSKDGIHGNWDTTKLFPHHLGFIPKHVIDLWNAKTKRDKCFHWDDAGYWLHNLDFQNKFVKDTGKYLQVARDDWACIMFSAISKEDVSSKVRGLRNAIIIDITKEGKGKDHPNRRTAFAYILRKGWKNREWKDEQWTETFDSHVPGNYNPDYPERVMYPTNEQKKNPNVSWGFYSWYKPLRSEYTKIAKQILKKDIEADNDLNVNPLTNK